MNLEMELTAFDREPDTAARLRRRKSLAIALILGLLVSLFYAVTIVRLKGNVAKRAQQQTSGFTKGMPTPAGAGAGADAVTPQGR
jgi:hypothetical protein